MDDLMLQAYIGHKLVNESRKMMNTEKLFVQNLCGGSLYKFRKRLNDANINTNYAHHKQNTPAVIKAEVEIWPEEQEHMVEM